MRLPFLVKLVTIHKDGVVLYSVSAEILVPAIYQTALKFSQAVS